MSNKLIVSPSPHIRDNATTSTIMRDVLIGLAPAMIAAVVIFGFRALLMTAVCVAACIIFEYGTERILGRENTISDLSAVVTGVILSFNLPVRKLINQGFLVLAMNYGLDSAILDPTNRDMLGLIYATEALLGLDDYCMVYFGDYRDGMIGPVKQ